MSDPGTCLAIVSLALQVSKGLLGYYDLWTHADEDVVEIQRSLLALANIFMQLDITLAKPNLSEDIISIIRITMKGCDTNVKKLEELLDKVRREGPPEKLRTKVKNLNRRVVQIFHHGETMRLQSVLNELREDLNMVVNLLNLNTTANSLDDLRKLHGQLTDMKDSLQNNNKERVEKEKEKARESRRSALVEWLAAPDVSAAHLSARNQREEGTGGWFLESREFLQWTSSGGSIWLAGDVGCGKTVLCSSVIESLKGRISQRGDRIAYFYFTFNDTGCHGITGYLRSMLRQLCLAGSVNPLMEALYQRCGLDPPSINQMQAALLAYLATACVPNSDTELEEDPHVYIVLDGLDEIPYGPDRTMLLRLLYQIAENDYPLLHILISSRPERDIEKEILGNLHWKTVTYSSGGARGDLSIYVANQIKLTPKLASLPDQAKQDLQEKLVEGSGGMFRWTALQMEELKKKRILRGRDVQNILSSLPKSLDATYERALLQIDSDLVYEAKTALQWLSCCIRPLYLEELVDASIINPDEETPFSEDFRISPFDLVELLPGLIKVNPSPESDEQRFLPRHYTITLAHFSVKEYLVSSRILDSLSHNYAINLELAHRHVARSSLAYIQHCLSAGSSHPRRHDHLDDFPLQLYAYSRWEMHVQFLVKHSDQIWTCVLETFREPSAALMWRASSWLSRKLGEESMVYHVDIPFQAFRSPDWPTHYLLCRAIVSGNEPLARVILESGLDLTDTALVGNLFRLALISSSRSCTRDTLRGQTNSFTIRSLSRSGDDAMPRMLLEFGYRPIASDLFLAVRHGSTRLLLRMVGRTENILFSDMMEGLDQAVASRRLQIAHILMQQLLSGTHSHPDKTFHTRDEAKKATFEIIFMSAVERNSPHLVTYLMESAADDLVGHLGLDSLFLGTVVSGMYHVAAAIRQNRGKRISEKTFLAAERWQNSVVTDELCLALLALFASRCRTPKPQQQTQTARKRMGKSLIQAYILGLEDKVVERVLQTWLRLDESFEPLHQEDPFDIPSNSSQSRHQHNRVFFDECLAEVRRRQRRRTSTSS
ncbi:hypothetical protein ACHAPT_012017 [Fusarium lateritium]